MGGGTSSYREIEDADTIVLWGSNARETHPIFFHHLLKGIRKGAKLFVIDPRRTSSAEWGQWVGIHVGTDIALANAVAREILAQGLEHREFIESATSGFEEFRQHVDKYTVQYAQETCGIQPTLIRELATAYASAESAQICWTLGITEHVTGVDNVLSLINLALLLRVNATDGGHNDDGRPSGKLAYYSGAGSLGGWLRAVVGQLAIDRHRREARLVHTEEDAELDRLTRDAGVETMTSDGFGANASPEDTLANALASTAVEKALARALTDLEDEDRLLVKLYYFDGLRLREAGAVLGFHEATASRRLTRIHHDVRKRVERELMDEHGWTKSEAAQSLAQVATALQTDVESLVRAPQQSLAQTVAVEGESAAI